RPCRKGPEPHGARLAPRHEHPAVGRDGRGPDARVVGTDRRHDPPTRDVPEHEVAALAPAGGYDELRAIRREIRLFDGTPCAELVGRRTRGARPPADDR